MLWRSRKSMSARGRSDIAVFCLKHISTLSVVKREAMWRQAMEKSVTQVWAAVEGDAPVGFVSVAGSRDSDTDSATRGSGILCSPKVLAPGSGTGAVDRGGRILQIGGLFGSYIMGVEGKPKGSQFLPGPGVSDRIGCEKVVEFGGARCVESRLRLRLVS